MPTRTLALLGPMLLFLPLVAPAQAPRLRPEVRAGLVLASWRGADVGDGAGTRTAVQGGGSLTYDLTPTLGVQVGLLYSQEGVDVDLGGGASMTFKQDYLRVPVSLRMHPIRPWVGALRPFVTLGGSVGFQVGCQVEATALGVSQHEACDDPDITSSGLSFVDTDFGGHVELGAELGHVELFCRYQLGFRSVVRGVSTGPSGPSGPALRTRAANDLDVKNRAFAIGLGFTF